MPRGTLEVLLVGCKGLEDSDFLGSVDPYVVLTCRTQEQKSSIGSGDVTELTLKIMDKDTFSNDDYLGEATISLEPLFMEGSLPPTAYNVVKNQEYCGEIRVGLTFTPEIISAKQILSCITQ
ncbi:Elicitor-responsive protein 3 [Citrus sinensis]|uniref:Elicitor-responsive protein 3 n=1 Tax=Citrus sinensis TaxID=2711 RepID=A0ACB8MQC0_CITSI|nr:elicitor-responsive protein 3-like isoform X5 [Citrus sinensis]KAH9732113.1 Elicitor-responsive protein 3 [Citrus sinensis]KAH9788009.1 Elicitor-responsive protein 3 [Citrus sinensis]